MFVMNAGRGSVVGLGEVPARGDSDRETALIWAMRRLAVLGPGARCPRVEVALLQAFGPAADEVAAALRCLMMALEAGAVRPLRLAPPGCGPRTEDEALLWAAVRAAAAGQAAACGRLALLLMPERVETAARICGLLGGLMRG